VAVHPGGSSSASVTRRSRHIDPAADKIIIVGTSGKEETWLPVLLQKPTVSR